MKTNFKKFLALVLSALMVLSSVGTLTIFAEECQHTWNEEAYKVDPTCAKQGYTLRECTKCGELEAYNFQPATGAHIYVEDKDQYVAPDCEHRNDPKPGKKVEICDVCKDVKTTEIPVQSANMNDLTADNWKYIQIGDKCGEYADSYYECQNNGGNAGGICGFTTVHTHDIKEHNYLAADKARIEPTCQTYGEIDFTCTDCGDVVVVKIAKLTTCTNREILSETAATCVAEGSKSMKCHDCGATWTEVIAKDLNNHVGLGPEATCTDPQICSACKEVVVNPYKHPDADVVRTIVPAKCDAPGSITDFCNRCQTQIYFEEIPATGHGDYTVIFVSAPTCGKDAVLDITCNACGYKVPDTEWKTWENIIGWQAPADHDYQTVTIPATCTTDEIITKTCSICGDVQTEIGELAKGHTPPMLPDGSLDNSKITWGVDDASENPSEHACLADYICEVCKEPVEDDPRFHRDGLTVQIVVEATCSTYGVSLDFCKYCGYKSDAYEVPPMHHEGFEQTVDPVAPTCKEDGHTGGVWCTSCLTWIKEPVVLSEKDVPCGAQNYTVVFNGKLPSCTEYAGLTVTCNVCGDAISPEIWGEWPGLASCKPLDHNYVPVPGKPASCIETGLTEGSQCTRCKHWAIEQTVIEKTEHTLDSMYVDATCAGWGYTLTWCTLDGCDYEVKEYNKVYDENGNPVYDKGNHWDPELWVYIINKPTCTTEGTAAIYCPACDTTDDHVTVASGDEKYSGEFWKNLRAQLVALGHVETEEPTIVVPATCSADGYKSWVCERCTAEYKREIISKDTVDKNVYANHTVGEVTYNTNGIEQNGKYYFRTPGCIYGGLLWWHCNDCGWNFTETEGTGLGHDYTDVVGVLIEEEVPATCTTEGKTAKYAFACKGGNWAIDGAGNKVWVPCTFIDYRGGETIEKAPHTPDEPVKENAQGATCLTGAKYDKVVYCVDCKIEIYRDPVEGDAPGHAYVYHEYQAPTCDDIGWNAYETCENCDYTTYVEIPALGHELILETGVTVFYPTCDTIGYVEAPCQRCDYVYYDEFAPALGHDPIADATCDDPSICDRCDAVLVPALGHELILETGVTVFYPTCQNSGYVKSPCKRCDYVHFEEFAPKLDCYYVETARVPSTCTVKGSVTYTCQNGCNGTYTEELPLENHKHFELNDGTICYDHVKNPTCTEEGWTKGAYCQNDFRTENKHCVGFCDKYVGECDCYKHHRIPKLAHAPELACDSEGNPRNDYISCDMAIFTYYICQYCGEGHGLNGATVPENGKIEGLITDYVAPHHEWDEGKDPTCYEPGYDGSRCEKCGIDNPDVTTTEKPATNHAPLKDLWHSADKVWETCTACGDEINLHGEYYVDDDTVHEVYEQIPGNAEKHRYTQYTLDYCRLDGCEFVAEPEIIDMKNLDHEWVHVDHKDATVYEAGYDVFVCKYCDYEINKTNDRIANTVEVEVVPGTIDENGNFDPEGTVVNGGKLALKIDMAAYDVAVSQLMFTLKVEADVLTFDQNTTAALNAGKDLEHAYWAFEDGTVRVISNKLEGADDFIVDDETGKGYITLVFDVATTAYLAGAASVNTLIGGFSATLTNSEIVADPYNTTPVTFAYVNDSVVATISRNADVSGDGILDLTDAHMALDLLSRDEYSVQADIDCDGEVTSLDYMLMQMILLNEGIDHAAYVQFLNLYIAK